MSPATRKSKRAAASAAKQEEPAVPQEAEERALKKQKEDPVATLPLAEPAPSLQTEPEQPALAQTEQKQGAPIVEAEPEAHAQGLDAPTDVAEPTAVVQVEDQTTEGIEGDGDGEDAVQETADDPEGGEDVEEAEEADEDCDRIQLDVEEETGDDGIEDEDDVGEPVMAQELADEKQEDNAASPGATQENVGTPKNTSTSRRDGETFPSKGKIFIGGLTWETTSDTLQKHFRKYGEITDSVVMKNRNTGHPRGFGFVTFADPSVCDKVLIDTHVIDGRTVEAKHTVPREKGSASSKGPKSKKIFVGGLTTATSEEELKAYFEKFGKVAEYQVMQDHKTGRSRGFGFVTFDSENAVDSILSQGRLLELNGKQVEVKIAEPKRAGQESNTGSRNSGRPFTSRGDSFTRDYETYDPYLARGSHSSRGGGRVGGPTYGGDAYRYGGGFSGIYGYGGLDDGYGGLGLNYPGFGSVPGYGGGYSGSYGGNAHGYGGGNSGHHHPYGR